MELVNQLIGWVGAIGLLTTFFLNSTEKMSTTTKSYIWINVGSALLLALNAYHLNAYPFLVVNVFWAIVALYGLVRTK